MADWSNAGGTPDGGVDGEEIRFSEDYETHYKVLSTASHEIMNYLSTIGSTYQYLDSRYPETQGFKFWGNIGTSINYLVDYMKQTSLCRYAHFPHIAQTTPQDITELIYEDLGECRYRDIIEYLYIDMDEPDAPIFCDCDHVASTVCQLVLNAYEAVNHLDESASAPVVNPLANQTSTGSPDSSDTFNATDTSCASNAHTMSDTPSASCINSATDIPGTSDDSGDSELAIHVHISSDSDYIRISVSNVGTLDPQYTPRQLTEPFFTTRANHAGCGLYLANIVCTAHNGYLSISSRDNTTRVTLSLRSQAQS